MGLFKRSIKEKLSNLKGKINSTLNSESGRVRPPSEMHLKFEDKFNTFNEDEWRMGEPWGDFHPSNLGVYFGKHEVIKTTNNELRLFLETIPKTYSVSDIPSWINTDGLPQTFEIPYCAGKVVTKKSWKYGWFEADIMLPEGMNLWPAFWLTGAITWPPEIDIFEAYSNNSPRYGKKMLGVMIDDWQIQPNLHYGSVANRTKEMYGSYDVRVKDCTRKFIQYACHWSRDFIRIYYNGIQVFETTDDNILKWFNRADSNMQVVINHGVVDGVGHGKGASRSVMRVKNFRIYQ